MTTSTTSLPPIPKPVQFPPHNAPRVWLLTNGTSPIALALARHVLAHGDYVVAGVLPADFKDDVRSQELKQFLDEVRWQGDGNSNGSGSGSGSGNGDGLGGDPDQEDEDDEGISNGNAKGTTNPKPTRWKERVRIVALDGRIVGQCQSTVAEAVEAFGRIDILLGCTSEALVGTIEELAQSPRTLTLVRDQFDTNFFANVNIIKAVLPVMRKQKSGHIIMMTAVTAHLGTPGLGMYCASQWAIEGYCDSLAYEIAPFNIKVTIVQPNLEISVLTNRITSAPPMPAYAPAANPAPLSRELLAGLLDRIGGDSSSVSAAALSATGSPTPGSDAVPTPRRDDGGTSSAPATAAAAAAAKPSTPGTALLTSPTAATLYPALHPSVKASLIAETVHALAAIGGHDNPPARHIVGFEGVASVKEKLKTVSEELEDFIDVSAAVDFGRSGGGGGE